MKKILSVLLVAAIALGCVLSLTGCDSGTAAAPDFVVNVGAFPDTIDPALNRAVDGATYIIHMFSGLVGYKQDASGKLVLFADCAKELPTATATDDGKYQYVFTLKDDLKWSDGSALTAADFVYSWNRACDPATGADYAYMFDIIDGYNDVIDMYEMTEDGSIAKNDDGTLKYKDGVKSLNVTASEDGKTITVVLPVDAPYALELFAFPAYMPVKKDVVEADPDGWATNVATYIGNGPYKASSFTQSELVAVKNEYYQNAADIVSDKITFAFNDDDASLLANYKNGSYLFIDSVPNDEIDALKAAYPTEFQIEGQLGTYYVCFNMNAECFKGFTQEEQADLRNALGLLIDRNYIVEEIGKAGQVPAAGFVAMGLTEPDGTEYISKNGVNGDGKGYYSVAAEDYTANCDEALALIKKVAASSGKFTVGADNKVVGFPTLEYITDKGTGHEAIATYLQGVFANYGISMNVTSQEWSTFLNTRKDGAYSIARNGWLGDYNDPISFLDMWTTDSGNNDCQFGKGEHASYKGYDGKTWAESYDATIAAVKACKDPTERFELMHKAENILMSTGAICPIYYYTDIFMCSPTIDSGFFSSPLGFKYFMYAKLDGSKKTSPVAGTTTADTTAAEADTTAADAADTTAA